MSTGALIVTILRLGRFRYLVLMVPPFAVGAMEGTQSPQFDTLYLVLGTMAIGLAQFTGSLWNCLSDRIEDELDHPHRVAFCEQVGYSQLRSLTKYLTLVFLGLVAAMTLICDLYFVAVLMWLFFQLATWSYSFGPRLKPRRFGATIFLGGVSGYFLMTGWIGGGISDMAPALSAGVLLGVFGASLTGSKDAPDIEGDQAAGYRSVYHDLREANRPFLRAIAVLSRPYVVAAALGALTLSEGPGWSLLWCWIVFPLAILVAWALTHAETPSEKGILRDVGYIYWMVFMGVVLVSLFPGALSLGISVASLAWYLMISQLLHPDPAPTVSQLWRGIRPGIS